MTPKAGGDKPLPYNRLFMGFIMQGGVGETYRQILGGKI
jgi:hypothetical protein